MTCIAGGPKPLPGIGIGKSPIVSTISSSSSCAVGRNGGSLANLALIAERWRSDILCECNLKRCRSGWESNSTGFCRPLPLRPLMLAFGPPWIRSCLKFHKSLFYLSRNFHGNEARPALPKPPIISMLITEQDTEEARTWLTQFVNVKVPKESVEFSFSRSSGPGGQVIWSHLNCFGWTSFWLHEFHRTWIKLTPKPLYDVLWIRRGFLVGLYLM